jgi:hypothetical protein
MKKAIELTSLKMNVPINRLVGKMPAVGNFGPPYGNTNR